MEAQTLARSDQRERLIGAVGAVQGAANASASGTTNSGVQQQAQSLDLIAQRPTELTTGSRTGAVRLVANLAGQDLALVSNTSSAAAVNALSSVSTAEGATLTAVAKALKEAPAGGNRRRLLAATAAGSCGNLKSVVGAVSTLSETHLSGQAPGETSASVSTPNIQMATSLASGATGGSGPVGAPGSPGSFDALPPSALRQAAAGTGAGASGSDDTAVGVKFLATAFDFHTCGAGVDPAFAGISRLELGAAGGGTVKVANLTTPITFSLPPPKTLEPGFLVGRGTPDKHSPSPAAVPATPSHSH
jgi:hypothetical protein